MAERISKPTELVDSTVVAVKELEMNQKRARIVLSSVVAAAAFGATGNGFGAESPDRAQAQLNALERRVIALERRNEAEATAPVATPSSRAQAKPADHSAIDVARYLQYPGE